jgi:hypothetical protein
MKKLEKLGFSGFKLELDEKLEKLDQDYPPIVYRI